MNYFPEDKSNPAVVACEMFDQKYLDMVLVVVGRTVVGRKIGLNPLGMS